MSRARSVSWLVGGVILAIPARSSLPEGWQALSHLGADAALRAFAAEPAVATSPAGREARLGQALALLGKQPIVTEQIDEAQRILTELAGSGTDETGLAARYFLGRIAQHHRQVADPEEAAHQFRQVVADGGASIWAQTAVTRLAVLELYALNAGRAPEVRVAAAEKLLAAAQGPAAQSELHLVLADAIFYYRLPEASALPHLLAAESLGRLDSPTRADVVVQIAEVSAAAGDRAQARRFYETFLAGFPLDQRVFMVKQKLKAL